MLTKLFQLLHDCVKELVRITRDFVTSVPYRGKGRWCPVCEKTPRKFRSFDILPREEIECPFCGASGKTPICVAILPQDDKSIRWNI